jgi:small subunit ribosomal protein S6
VTKLYEGMFLLDNQVVRAGWDGAKKVVTGALEKHGKVVTARRWDERRLAYPIKNKKRATYLLAYYESPESEVQNLRRDLELDERILRYLLVKSEGVPDKERELAAAEDAAGFAPPMPPQDDELSRAEREGELGREGEPEERPEEPAPATEEEAPALEEV